MLQKFVACSILRSDDTKGSSSKVGKLILHAVVWPLETGSQSPGGGPHMQTTAADDHSMKVEVHILVHLP